MVQTLSIKQLAMQIKEDPRKKFPTLIGISGFGGSGKSTAADQLAALLDDAIVIAVDQFIIDRLSDRSSDWSGIDWQRLITQVLEPLKHGTKTIEYNCYDWPNNNLGEIKRVDAVHYIIIEGIGLLRPELNPYFDYKIWIDTDIDAAVERGKRRDRDAGAAHDQMWDRVWKSNDLDYFEKYHPKQMADFLLTF